MNFITCLDISSSGLQAQRKRMEIIAGNLANIETTRTEGGGPYRRKMIVMGAKALDRDFRSLLSGAAEAVEVQEVVEDPSPFKRVYNPSHPDAGQDGYLLKPNVDLVVETTNMLMARRAFEANVAAMKASRQMALKALEIGK